MVCIGSGLVRYVDVKIWIRHRRRTTRDLNSFSSWPVQVSVLTSYVYLLGVSRLQPVTLRVIPLIQLLWLCQSGRRRRGEIFVGGSSGKTSDDEDIDERARRRVPFRVVIDMRERESRTRLPNLEHVNLLSQARAIASRLCFSKPAEVNATSNRNLNA